MAPSHYLRETPNVRYRETTEDPEVVMAKSQKRKRAGTVDGEYVYESQTEDADEFASGNEEPQPKKSKTTTASTRKATRVPAATSKPTQSRKQAAPVRTSQNKAQDKSARSGPSKDMPPPPRPEGNLPRQPLQDDALIPTPISNAARDRHLKVALHDMQALEIENIKLIERLRDDNQAHRNELEQERRDREELVRAERNVAADLRGDVAIANRERDRATDEAETRQTENDKLKEELKTKDEFIEKQTRAGNAAIKERNKLRQEVPVLKEAKEELERKADKIKSDNEGLVAANESLKAKIEGLKAEAKRPKAATEVDKVARELAGLEVLDMMQVMNAIGELKKVIAAEEEAGGETVQ